MSGRNRQAGAQSVDDIIDLTQTIRKLSVPEPPVGGNRSEEEPTRKAMLVSRDTESQKWGSRWLRHERLEVVQHSDADDALRAAKSVEPDVIVLDAAMRDSAGESLYQLFQDAADVTAPLIVLCSGAKELAAALQADVHDVVRKPIEWQLVGRRARHAASAGSTREALEQARDSLSIALKLADSARLRLRSRESFEPVTGLPNKSKFSELLKRGMRAADRDKTVLAVFVIGLSRFRLVIEAMGQEHADIVLAEIGVMLSEWLRDAGSGLVQTSGLRTAAAGSLDLARFGVMMTCSGKRDELMSLQQMLVEILSRPVQVSGQSVYLSASVGVALYPNDASDVDSLLQRADNAMRDSQSNGGGFKFYCAEMDAAAARKLKLEHLLHEALDRGELKVAYQPIVTIAGGRVTAAEALLRWQQPDGTFINPDEFVPIAEESGLMNRIGEFVLTRACQQLKAWQRSGLGISRVCVNVSKRQLMSGSFVPTVQRILARFNLEPAALDLELSERGVLGGDLQVISELDALKGLGVRLSIDDFGTGDSAIGYLKELPIDLLKIDRSYVAGLTENDKDAAITSAMVALAHRLDLTVVAEGVETREQLQVLRDLECDEFQGYLVAPALSPADFAKLFERNRRK